MGCDDMKPYDLGLLVGRFQHFHKGHESLVDNGLKLCDRMLILVGSAQEVGTQRNPFDVSTRIDVIRSIFCDCLVEVKPLPDMSKDPEAPENITPEWGRYVLQHVKQYVLKRPEIMIYGNDDARSKWFDPFDIQDTMEVIVPRSRIPISATMMREYLVNDNFDNWMKFVHPRVHKLYPRLRTELLSTVPYREMYESMMGGKRL
jgi:bifunctional NMN adenylyltransferase/nudix hydrolase